MQTKIFTKLAFVICCINLTACGTITSLAKENYSPYAGVVLDFKMMQEGGILSVLSVIDLPLSFILDTLMLPVTLS